MPWGRNVDVAHMTLKRMRVNPKDKHSQENAGVVYQVPCTDCPCVYTGVTERRYRVKEKEHKRDAKILEEKYTSYHVEKENHTIDWVGVNFPTRDTDWTARE